jgi:Caspase domain
VASRYRALLIGNSTYPADEHNLQTLKGPVKDIATLNRGLIEPGAGLFDDTDVTLLAEATSSRAIRALGKFFGIATRDDVLLIYYSGHGKLDQTGRLHLCMQDTDSTDLLSTAVSSARINEFADASRARNVVIVLDCCHAGAFRSADLGQAVAGPGRYVLTSCRGTQLANDATVENGTSVFTQHLVDGLVYAAPDQDGDGYVTFSDLYAYVDRRLREDGKQIPQRRVDGDGDLPLAKRPLPALAKVKTADERRAEDLEATHPPQEQQASTKSPAAPSTQPVSTWPPTLADSHGRRTRRRSTALLIALIGLVAAITAVAAALASTGSSPKHHIPAAAHANTAAPPGRLVFEDSFSNPNSGWLPDLNQDGTGSASYVSDGYQVTVLKPLPTLNTFSVASPYSKKLPAMAVTVDSTFVSAAPADGAGVRCDWMGRTAVRYTFEVYAHGAWVIFRLGGPGTEVIAQGTSPAIRTGKATNTVTGQCSQLANGTTALALTVNGVKLSNAVNSPNTLDTRVVGWHAALVVSRSQSSPGTVARFTNFRINEPGSP